MGNAPYMLTEQGVGVFSSFSAFNPERVPTFELHLCSSKCVCFRASLESLVILQAILAGLFGAGS